MAITQVGTPTTATAIDGGNVTVTLPSGLAQNDLVLVQCGNAKNAGGAAVSSGWTQAIQTDQSTLTRQTWYYKVMGATPDTSFEFTGTGAAADAGSAVARAYRGVDTTTPMDATPTSATANSTNPNPPSITTVTNGAWVVVGASGRLNDTTVVAPTGYGNLAGAGATDTNPCCSNSADKEISTAGAEDAGTFTTWGSSNHVVHALALRPAATNKTITAGTDSYALTGQAAGLKFGFEAAGGAGSYALTGQTATLNKGQTLTAGANSYAITGQTASFIKISKIAAGTVSYSISGQDVAVRLGKTLSGAAGSYLQTGTDAALRYTILFAANAIAYSHFGSTISLEKAAKLAAAAGSYAQTGQSATLTYTVSGSTYTIVGEAGAYTITGQATSLEFGHKVSGGAGSYTITGQAASPFRGRTVSASAGSYAHTGSNANFVQGARVIQGSAGSYLITGKVVDLDAVLERGAIQDIYYGTSGRKKKFWKEVRASALRRGTWMT